MTLIHAVGNASEKRNNNYFYHPYQKNNDHLETPLLVSLFQFSNTSPRRGNPDTLTIQRKIGLNTSCKPYQAVEICSGLRI